MTETATIRISIAARSTLQELSKRCGESMTDLLEKAVEKLRRDIILEETNTAYAFLRSDPESWNEELKERELWENTLKDGLEEDSVDVKPKSR